MSDNCKLPDSEYGYFTATINNLEPGTEIPNTSFISAWHSVSDPNCGYLPQSNSIFTMYNLSGDYYFSSSFKIKPNNEGYVYFTNPQAPYPYQLLELTGCNNLFIHNPFILDIDGGCDYYSRN